MSIYPAAIPDNGDYPERTDDVDWIYAERYNEIKNEVIAICAELGINPRGASADVVTRLALLALKTNVLEKDNITEFVPSADYHPATKKFVDDSVFDPAIPGEIGGTTPAAGTFTDLLMTTGLAANLRMFANAAGDGAEWANGIKVGTISYDTATATGTVAETGVGFKPSNVLFLAVIANTSQVSFGLDNGSVHYCVMNTYITGAGRWAPIGTKSIYFNQASGVTAHAYISALGSDGFTLSWTKNGAKVGTATIYYIAFR